MDTENVRADGPDMLRAALWYAAKGIHVFPVHEPLFDHPLGYLCTCEEYRHSELCKRRDEERTRKGLKPLHLGPGDHCNEPGKHPRGVKSWSKESTTDPDTIRGWWAKYPTANIAADCGKSRLLVPDLDKYKDEYAGDNLLSRADEETVTKITGNLGTHLWYRMPDGKSWGNNNTGLPAGIDIRGAGGYVLLAPSLHKSGRRYAFETGYELGNIEILPVPDKLAELLDRAAQSSPSRASCGVTAHFTETTTARPDLAAWNLSQTTIEKIHNPAERGKRSEADYSVCLALCYAGLNDTEILSVFQHYPIGTNGKYSERGPDYLARTVGNARTYVAQNPGPEQVRAMIPAMREWVKTVSFAEFVPTELQSATGYRTDGTDTKAADALLDVCEERGTFRVILSPRDLALRAGLGSHHTASKALDRLAGWFVDREGDGCLHVARRLPSIPTIGGDREMGNLRATYSARKADDVFLAGRSKLAAKLVNEEAGLGEAILRIVDALEGLGTATRRELAEHTGKTLSACGRACRRAEELGILDADQPGGAFSPKQYSLLDWENRVEELRPTLKTYNLGLERIERTVEARQRYAEHRLKSPNLADEERAALTRTRERAVGQRLALGPILRPHLTREEQRRYVVDPVAAMATSKAAYDERRTQDYEGLMRRGNALLSAGLLRAWELAELRGIVGRLGMDMATVATMDSGGGYAWAYAGRA